MTGRAANRSAALLARGGGGAARRALSRAVGGGGGGRQRAGRALPAPTRPPGPVPAAMSEEKPKVSSARRGGGLAGAGRAAGRAGGGEGRAWPCADLRSSGFSPQEGVKTENDHINLKVAGQDGSVVQFKIKRHTPLSKLMKAYCERQVRASPRRCRGRPRPCAWGSARWGEARAAGSGQRLGLAAARGGLPLLPRSEGSAPSRASNAAWFRVCVGSGRGWEPGGRQSGVRREQGGSGSVGCQVGLKPLVCLYEEPLALTHTHTHTQHGVLWVRASCSPLQSPCCHSSSSTASIQQPCSFPLYSSSDMEFPIHLRSLNLNLVTVSSDSESVNALFGFEARSMLPHVYFSSHLQGLSMRQIRFRFDGQPINEADTPAQV